jgi:hypothetical protein
MEEAFAWVVAVQEQFADPGASEAAGHNARRAILPIARIN